MQTIIAKDRGLTIQTKQKKATDYVLWNRLNQVSNPARLDEGGA